MVASMNPDDGNGDSVPKLDPRTARSQLRAKVQGFGRALDRATSEGAAVGKAALRVIVSDLARAVLDDIEPASAAPPAPVSTPRLDARLDAGLAGPAADAAAEPALRQEAFSALQKADDGTGEVAPAVKWLPKAPAKADAAPADASRAKKCSTRRRRRSSAG